MAESFAPALGVVCLDDLWIPNRGETRLEEILRLAGVVPAEEVCRSSPPPSELVVFCSSGLVGLFGFYGAWMSECRSLTVVVSYHDTPGAWEDSEFRELVDWEFQETSQGLPVRESRSVPDYRSPEILDWLAALLNQGPVAARPHQTFPPIVAAQPAGPWLSVPDSPELDPETYWPPLVGTRQGVPTVYLPSRRAFLSLSDGSLFESVSHQEIGNVGVWPTGDRLWFGLPYSVNSTVLDLASGKSTRQSTAKGQPIGVWPDSRLAWAGARCRYSWLYRSGEKLGVLAQCEHDPPCGHAKKLYGYFDNFPCWIHLTEREDAYLSVYVKDAVVSSSVPISWTRCGNAWAYLHRENSDSRRCLFFVCEGLHGQNDPADPMAYDARDARPVIVLGPSQGARYVLDLSRPVYRLINQQSVLVHDPVEAYGVFDHAHRLVRLKPGRLLGGWGEYLTVLRGEHLYRDDTESGDSFPLGPAGADIAWAFSFPRSPNVVLVSGQKEETRLRLV